MTANTSSAVMQQRREAHDSLDDFPTPPWATRALCERLQNEWDQILGGKAPGWTPGKMICREPAANRGHMVRPLTEYFASVEASDIHDYGAGFPVRDYLFGSPPPMVDWTITNPPFRLAEQFIDRARETSRHGVAVIVRTAFLESVSRYNSLFKVTLTIADQTFVVVDIGMRMLTPRELFNAQGFPADYAIEGHWIEAAGDWTWKPFPKDVQVSCCGNSVCPDLARALVEANCTHLMKLEQVA